MQPAHCARPSYSVLRGVGRSSGTWGRHWRTPAMRTLRGWNGRAPAPLGVSIRSGRALRCRSSRVCNGMRRFYLALVLVAFAAPRSIAATDQHGCELYRLWNIRAPAAGDHSDCAELSRAFRLRAHGKPNEAETLFRKLADAGETSDNVSLAAQAHRGLGSVYSLESHLPAAQREFETALALFQRLEDVDGIFDVHL